MERGSSKRAGFTLVEMLVTCGVMSIVASIAVPSLLSRRATANERAAVATLRAIANAQMQFKTSTALDADRDGSTEYGTLPELAGVSGLRSGAAPLIPAMLSSPLGVLDAQGFLQRTGFHFALYLPDAAGVGLATTPANLPNIDATLARDYWTCVAWPTTRDATGSATFFVNQRGEIVQSKDAPYSGRGSVPPAGCALVGGAATRIDREAVATSALGADGFRWLPVQ